MRSRASWLRTILWVMAGVLTVTALEGRTRAGDLYKEFLSARSAAHRP